MALVSPRAGHAAVVSTTFSRTAVLLTMSRKLWVQLWRIPLKDPSTSIYYFLSVYLYFEGELFYRHTHTSYFITCMILHSQRSDLREGRIHI